jgi:hypothetical protein
MNRYTQSNSRVYKRYDGKRAMVTTRYPKIPVGANDVYIFASETDYLDALAQKFYRDTSLWWIIAQANGIKNTLKAPVGKQLRIPQNINSIIADFNSANR